VGHGRSGEGPSPFGYQLGQALLASSDLGGASPRKAEEAWLVDCGKRRGPNPPEMPLSSTDSTQPTDYSGRPNHERRDAARRSASAMASTPRAFTTSDSWMV